MGALKQPEICRRGNAAEHKLYSRFLEYIIDNFLIQTIQEPMNGNDLLDLIFANKAACMDEQGAPG